MRVEFFDADTAVRGEIEDGLSVGGRIERPRLVLVPLVLVLVLLSPAPAPSPVPAPLRPVPLPLLLA